VHVTAFPRGDSQLPTVGEPLSFEIELDRDGRKRAVRVRRPGAAEPSALRRPPSEQTRPRPRRETERAASGWVGAVVSLLVVAAAGWYGYTHLAQKFAAPKATGQNALGLPQATTPSLKPPGFQCDGRKHCSQMASCSEAKLFLAHCPGVLMDGDGDGIPCEEQHCSGPLAD